MHTTKKGMILTVKKELIVTAKSVEDARKKAATELGIAAEDMMVTVLEEGKRGFLGIGAIEAKIAVTYTAKDETTADKKPEPVAKRTEAPATPAEQNKGVAAALSFLRQVAEDMGLDSLTYRTADGTNGDTVIAVDGENAGLLIGHHGETLDALQYLSNLAANRKEEGEKRGYVRITLDIEGYREKREEALRALARRKAEKVLRDKRSAILEPMNPYERRIIHSEVQSVPGVSTRSIGVDSNRRVVIFLEEDQPTEE